MTLETIRNDYLKGSLLEDDCPESPLDLFENWINQAVDRAVNEPMAMVLSSVSVKGKPSSRVVLLRDFGENGLKFYSNYVSRKGLEFVLNPSATSLFFWPELERQIIIEGVISKTNPEESDRYFNSRPLESKVNSIISPQSQVIPDRDFLIEQKKTFLNQKEENLKRPDHWGGYLLKPSRFEFWQGGPARLNDRIQYEANGSTWKRSRLAP